MRNRRDGSWVGLAGGALGCGVAILAVVVVAGVLAALAVSRWDPELSVGPGKGTESLRLAVAVSPATGLTEDAVVTITSDAFEPDHVVGVAVCRREADTRSEGVDACDKTSGARYATDSTGRLRATFPVPRVITVRGRAHDCAAPGARCRLVAADASDFDRSGGRPIRFRSDLPAVDLVPGGDRPRSDRLPATATPAEPVVPGTTLQVEVRGFQPGEPLLLARCVDFPDKPIESSCEPLDQDQALSAIMGHDVSGISLRARPDGTLVTTAVAAPVARPFGAEKPIACTTAPGRCAIVVAAAADTKRSAVLPYTIKPG